MTLSFLTNFYTFQGQKIRFFDFLKIFLKLFRSCLGIICGLRRPAFECIYSSKDF